jgi:proteasome lid subunit RPN8/RPN11
VKHPSGCPESIAITSDVLRAIVAHAADAAPRECCGLLVGTRCRVDESVPTRNVDPNPTRFRINPAEHIDLNRRLRGSGRTVVGVYHSHVRSAAEPSDSDVAEASYPEFVHVIVSLAGESQTAVRAFRIAAGVVTPLALEIEIPEAPS